MADYRVETVLDVKAELGECPLWSVEDQALYWLDIDASTINRFEPRSGRNTAWLLPAMPGCFAFREGGGAVIAARDGIYDIAFTTGRVERLAAVAHDPALFRANDGRTDRQGRLWFGTVRAGHEVFDVSGTAYYRYDGERLEKMLDEVGMTNGTAFSPDGRTLYRGQTESGRIFAYDYDPLAGTPSNERVFAVVPQEFGVPDGAAVDTEGGYWAALPVFPPGQAGGVGRFAPDGRLDVFVQMPTPMPTMVAFGGPDLSTLYVTSGRFSALVPGEPPPTAGNIFAVETRFRGVPETPFRGRGNSAT